MSITNPVNNKLTTEENANSLTNTPLEDQAGLEVPPYETFMQKFYNLMSLGDATPLPTLILLQKRVLRQ